MIKLIKIRSNPTKRGARARGASTVSVQQFGDRKRTSRLRVRCLAVPSCVPSVAGRYDTKERRAVPGYGPSEAVWSSTKRSFFPRHFVDTSMLEASRAFGASLGTIVECGMG